MIAIASKDEFLVEEFKHDIMKVVYEYNLKAQLLSPNVV